MDSSELKPKHIEELRPHIYQFRNERFGSHVYLVKGFKKNVLIDTGKASNYPNLKVCLEQVGLAPQDIHLIILTHEHFDHTGACPEFYESAVIAAHPLAANKIGLQDEFVTMSKYGDEGARHFRVDIWLEADTVVDLGNYRLHILHTPGHCSGCICIYEPDQELLFSGDTVLAGGTLSGIMGSGNISDYIKSLQRLSDLKVEEMYPGHGRISTDAEGDLLKALENALGMMEECKILFATLNTKSTFDRYFSAIRKRPVIPTSSPKV
jgi:glyoxylase-like metal-dependent hydrolase (beta-lactamase superfamily II)